MPSPVFKCGKPKLYPRSRRQDGPQGRLEVLGKSKMSCSYQNRNSELPFCRINSALSFVIIFITDFRLTVLDLRILKLKVEKYRIYEAKEPF